jgi:hypothetical protein
MPGRLRVTPERFETTQRYSLPMSQRVVGGVVYAGEVAPGISTRFFCHWYRRSRPVASTVNVAGVDRARVASPGWAVMTGAPAAGDGQSARSIS